MTIYSSVRSKEYTANYKEKGSDFMARKSRISEYNKIPMRKKIGVDVEIMIKVLFLCHGSIISPNLRILILEAVRVGKIGEL